jgi:hypothetical protein
MALLYVVAGWLLLQLTSLLVLATSADWVYRFLFGIWVICVPRLLVYSWIYEITPEGLKKERDVLRERSITVQTGEKISKAIWVTFVVAVVLQIVRLLMA